MRPTNGNAQTKTLYSDLAVCLIITLTLSLSSLPTTWALSDFRLCADEKCERIISMGSAKITYMSGEEGMIPFKIHSPMRILSKSAGSNPKLWGVEINGRRGYANKDFIMEKKILIKESDLTYEVPVVWPLKPEAGAPPPPAAAAPATPPVINNPGQAVTVEPVLPVLNASETVDDVATTTTSPLDKLKMAILTEQDQASSSSSEASTPITPVQPNLRMVDGTQLPLEVVPAVVERGQNQTAAEQTKNEAAKIDETKSEQETFNDYEEDDDEVYEEDDDEQATLDSNFPKIAGIEATADNKLEQVLNSSGEAEAKHAASAETEILQKPATYNEIVSEKPPATNNDNLLIETRNVTAVPVSQEEEKLKPQLETVKAPSEPTIPANAIDNEPKVETKVQQEEEKMIEKLEPQTIKVETPSEPQQKVNEPTTQAKPIDELPKVETKEQQQEQKVPEKLEPQSITVETPSEPQQIVKEPTIQAVVIDNELPKVKTKEQVMSEKVKEAQPLQNQAATEAQPVPTVTNDEKEKVDQENTTETVPTPTATTVAEGQELVKENVVETGQPIAKQIVPTQEDQVKTQATQEKDQNDEKLAEKTITEQTQQAPASETKQEAPIPPEVVAQPEVQTSEAAPVEAITEATPVVAPIKAEQIEVPTQPKAVVDPVQNLYEPTSEEIVNAPSTQATPSAVPASLPPLFKKQHMHNPNEYYKKLQEERLQQQQQKQQQQDPQQQQRQPSDTHQHVLPEQALPDLQTTPKPDTGNTYDAVYEAEPTPAPLKVEPVEPNVAIGTVEPIGLPASTPQEPIREDAGPGLGLFSTIMDTVNTFISSQGQGLKEPETAPLKGHDELHRLLYPEAANSKGDANAEGHCNRPMNEGNCHSAITLDNFVEVFAQKVLDNILALLCVLIAAASSLFFILTYYCFCNSSQEGSLLSKLNHLERSLLAAHKENQIVKHELMTTRTKLSSIEDNSFGSNDMVVALKKQLETELYEKAKLQEQISSLEKDLDNAAEAGLELNKMLSEVLNGQNGDEVFMSTVEELQRQLNDQEKIIIDINASLAEKSRENSELQYSFTESTTRLNGELKSLQQDNYELEMEKAKLQTRIEEVQAESEQELAKALEARNYEMQRLQHQIMELSAKNDKEHSELQTSLAKIEALEDCLKMLKKDPNTNVQELITSAKTRGELNAAQKKFRTLQTKLEQELAAKARLENQLQTSSADVEQLKQDFNQSERDKLEAQTRLEVLSGYFREKETQLQKELSLQEAKWLQHQGENASTVETQTLMKNEIQTLKSQNDELRAEIEAQIASHKAQMGTLENRAHESWLAARQSERRCEEAQAEAAALRRKLTAMASGAGAGAVGDLTLDSLPANGLLVAPDLTGAPSPLPLPGSPGLLNMPNPLPFLPAPFSPFMGLPPPFLPPPAGGVGGARPPPLGRMRSPPPASSSRDRYSPQRDDRDDRDDYSDYDDYDDDDDDERGMDRHRRHSGSWGRAHRDSYMHSPRTYRSLSPSDSRYNYNDTETDFSPPPSPLPPPRKNSSRPINEV